MILENSPADNGQPVVWTADALADNFTKVNGIESSADALSAQFRGMCNDLDAHLRRLDIAERDLQRARGLPDEQQAQAIRDDAAGSFWAATQAMADLFLTLLRNASHRRHHALQLILVALLKPELTPIAQAVAAHEQRLARLEARR
jgi:hypothetical protein